MGLSVMETPEGLTYFRPSQVKDYNEKTSAIYLSGVLLDGKMAPFIGDNLSVPSDFKSIVLSFSQLDYQSVGNIVFDIASTGANGSAMRLETIASTSQVCRMDIIV